MLDPKFMDEQLNINREEIAKRYEQMGAERPAPTPQQEGEFEVDVDYGSPAQQDMYYEGEPVPVDKPESPNKEMPRPKIARPGKQFAQDNPIFEGGPLESELQAWKKQFGRVYMTEIEGEAFIWRKLNRFEYKELMSMPNTNELMREEMICEIAVLFPHNYTYESMVNEAGGIPSTLAENIMKKSGFTRQVRTIAL